MNIFLRLGLLLLLWTAILLVAWSLLLVASHA